MLLPEYFKDHELACPCGCGLMPSKRSVEKLYMFRMLRNKPTRINSAARCPVYNANIGGAVKSAHLVGAFDIDTDRESEFEDLKNALAAGFTGIGISDNEFMHMDDEREEPAIWTY